MVTESIPGAGGAGYLVAVGTGSRDEAPGSFGISHLLEHVVFRATGSRTSFQMSKEIEGAGGEMNAFTAKEATAFYAVTLKETAGVAKDLVADIVRDPLIGAEDTEMEKKIVLQEISMCENDPDSYIHDLFAETLWRGHSLSQGEAGLRKSVKRLTSEDLRAYHAERYRIPRLAAFACGAVTQKDALKWASESFDGMAGGAPAAREPPSTPGSGYAFYKRKGDHCYLAMGFPAYGARHPDRAALNMLSAVLGSGSSSRLFQAVREERALVYSVYTSVDQHSDAGSVAAYLSSTEENVLEAAEVAASVCRELRDEGLRPGELQRAKNLVKGANVRYMESAEHRLYRMARSFMLTGEPETLEERLAAYDAVTEEDVMRVAADLIDARRLNVAMYGPKVKAMKGFEASQLDLRRRSLNCEIRWSTASAAEPTAASTFGVMPSWTVWRSSASIATNITQSGIRSGSMSRPIFMAVARLMSWAGASPMVGSKSSGSNSITVPGSYCPVCIASTMTALRCPQSRGMMSRPPTASSHVSTPSIPISPMRRATSRPTASSDIIGLPSPITRIVSLRPSVIAHPHAPAGISSLRPGGTATPGARGL